MSVFEVDYVIKDMDKYKAEPKLLPKYVVAESVQEAVKRALEFEDANLSLLKCDKVITGVVALAKKFKGVEPTKETKNV